MNRMKLAFVMLLWGSIGVFTRYIAATPILLAFLRALIAIPVLFIFYRLNKNKDTFTIKKMIPFIMSGSILGLAWVCLFIAFKSISISVAVLVYNMCPIYVLIFTPLILKERLSKIQIITVAGAFLGLVTIVGGAVSVSEFNWVGLALGTLSGLLYAALVIINRLVKTEQDTSTGTFIQMISATIILLPFVISENPIKSVVQLDLLSIVLILILGSIHTGVAYRMYFSTYKKLSAITIVSYSYLEPVFSIILSVVMLGEVLSVNQIIGGGLILGSTYLGEYAKKD